MAEFQMHIAQPPSFSKEEANLRRERLAGLKVEYGIKTQKYELLVQALGVSGTEASVCPCCDQKVDGTQFSADAAEKLKIFLEEHKQTIASLEDDLRQIDAELNAYDARTTKLSENAGAFAAQKKTVELQLEDKKEEDIEYLKLVKDNALTAKATVDSYKTRLVTVEQDSKTYYDNLIQLEKKLIDVEFLSDEKVAELKKEQDELVARIEKGTQVSSVTAALQIDVGNVKSQLVHAKSELMDLEQKLSDIGPELKDVNLPYEQESVEKLKAQQVERNKIVALVEAAAKTVNEKELRLKEVEDKIAANQKKTDLIKSLKKVKEAFSRTGIPLAYVNHRFKQVLALAQDNLVSLDANFSVEPDPDNAVSFLFTRNDSDDTTAMPMSRLSGGQKVRLTVAFLMAVQQLIIPDVGLLILDEPSVHLDEEGVNSLCEMLISLSRKLRNTECQVWVCDHNTILEAAFSSFMRLK
jgi:exonuclease SbcC